MLRKKSLLILVLVLGFILCANLASAQALIWKSDAGFYVYSFSEFGLTLDMGMVAGGPADILDPAGDGTHPLGYANFAFEFGSPSSAGLPYFGFYPTFNVAVAEGDEDGVGAINVFGRIRMRLNPTMTGGTVGLSNYGAFASWTAAKGMTVRLGTERPFSGYIFYERPDFDSYLSLIMDLEALGGALAFTIGTANDPLALCTGTYQLRYAGTALDQTAGYDGGLLGGTYYAAAGGQVGPIFGEEYMVALELDANFTPDSETTAALLTFVLNYHFVNPIGWVSAYEYDPDFLYWDPVTFEPDPTLSETTPIQGRTNAFTGLPYRNKNGILISLVDFVFAMVLGEGDSAPSLTIEVTNFAQLGLSVGTYEEYVGLMVAFGMPMSGMSLLAQLNFSFGMEGASAAVADGYNFDAVAAVSTMPISLYVEMAVDIDAEKGVALVPYLNAYADLGGLLYTSTGTGDVDNSRMWRLVIGANFYLNPYFMLPFSVAVSNEVTKWSELSADIFGAIIYGNVGPNPDPYYLTTKIYISFGLAASF